MTDTRGLPAALRESAVPRWSHRDPVEGGNPFSARDERHRAWDAATRDALQELAAIDARLAREPLAPGAATYRARVIDLAARRFDVWARRGLTVVDSEEACREYERWLTAYTENWVRYVGETVPRVTFGSAVRDRMAERAAHWSGDASFRMKNEE